MQIIKELLGIPCPTASDALAALGTELYIAPASAQLLLPALGSRFVNAACLDRIPNIFGHPYCVKNLNFHMFTPELLAKHLHTVLPQG